MNRSNGFPAGKDGKYMKDKFTGLLNRFSEQPHLLELFREVKMLPAH